jgi:hypothetical protein
MFTKTFALLKKGLAYKRKLYYISPQIITFLKEKLMQRWKFGNIFFRLKRGRCAEKKASKLSLLFNKLFVKSGPLY